MATREENIKKINIELEKLSDEELDKVAGGSWFITEEDAKKAGYVGRRCRFHRLNAHQSLRQQI